jgi:hypothetical protein
MRRITILFAALALTVACTNDLETLTPGLDSQRPITIPGDATEGEIIIKFSPEMEDILDATLTRSGGVATRSGIPSTDEVLDILGAYSFERVFPVDPRHEERTREAGLHLWYIVHFDQGEDIASAYERLSKLGEVDQLQCNRKFLNGHFSISSEMFSAAGAAYVSCTTLPRW